MHYVLDICAGACTNTHTVHQQQVFAGNEFDHVRDTFRHFQESQWSDVCSQVFDTYNRKSSGLKNQISGLMALTEQFGFFAQTMSVKINNVLKSIERINESIHSINSIANKSNESLNNLVAATEELTAANESISQISRSADTDAQKAVGSVTNTVDIVRGFNNSTKEIDDIVTIILEIADQTKMLALNASIEAARAGDLGKGFAIVATEVDELATQTNCSLEGIADKVAAMQRSAVETEKEIESVKNTIHEVKEKISETSSGITQQNESAKIISDATQSVADEIATLYSSTHDLSNFSEEIVQSLHSISTVGTSVKRATTKNGELVDILSQKIAALKELSFNTSQNSRA